MDGGEFGKDQGGQVANPVDGVFPDRRAIWKTQYPLAEGFRMGQADFPRAVLAIRLHVVNARMEIAPDQYAFGMQRVVENVASSLRPWRAKLRDYVVVVGGVCRGSSMNFKPGIPARRSR